MGEDAESKSTEPVFVIRLFERIGGVYSADITNCVGTQIGSASAPDFWSIWAMLEAVLERELPGGPD